MLTFVITVASVIVITMLIALAVLMRNPGSLIYRGLFILTCSACLWVAAVNLHGLVGPSLGLHIVRGSFAAVLLLGFSMIVFVNSLIGGFKSKRSYILFGLLLAGGIVLSFSDLVIERYASYEAGVNNVLGRGDAYLVVIAITLTFIVYALYRLTRQIFKSKGDRRTQLIIVESGLILGVVSGITTNVVLPNITHNSTASRFAFIAIIFWTTFLTYAVIQHRFLDIRLTAARAVAYIISLTVLALLYVGGVLIVVGLFLGDLDPGGSIVQGVYIVASLILAITFHPLKRQMDKLTNRIFFRNPYDTEQVLDKVSSIVIEQMQVDRLLREVGQVVMDSVLPVSLQFLVVKGDEISRRVVLGKDMQPSMLLMKALQENPYSVIMVDEIDQGITKLNKLLIQNDIALCVRLQTHEETVGYILMGNKSHGATLTRQDVDLMRIIATELAVAVQNVSRYEEIENFNVTLQEKIQDATKKLRQTNDKLRQMDQTKDDFISMASHQLRTPLTSIKGYVSMVLDGDAGPTTPQQKKMLNQAFISSQRMVYLISDLLNVSRLKTGKFVIEPVQTNLAKVIQDEVEQLQETAKGRNLTLTYNKPAHFPTLMLDETKLRQVIMNFMDNAIYYTPQGGNITVHLMDKPLSVEFTVVDDGIGVPKHEQHHLFSKFYRAHNAKRARPDGTGLGLFMAKKVIVAQGGAIIFRSKEGQGSTFGFTFAKEKVSAAPDKQIVVKHDD